MVRQDSVTKGTPNQPVRSSATVSKWFQKSPSDLVLRRPRSSGALAGARGRLAPAKAPEGRLLGLAPMVRDALRRAALLTTRAEEFLTSSRLYPRNISARPDATGPA